MKREQEGRTRGEQDGENKSKKGTRAARWKMRLVKNERNRKTVQIR